MKIPKCLSVICVFGPCSFSKKMENSKLEVDINDSSLLQNGILHLAL